MLRDGRRIRLGRVGIIIGLIAIGIAMKVLVQEGSWPALIPNVPLVILNDTPLGEHRTPLRKEVKKRVKERKIKGYSGKSLAWVLVKDLRHDQVRWNAHEGLQTLRKMWPECQDALENEVVVGGSQSRVIAAKILRKNATTPSVALLKACVQDLHDDRSEPGAYLRSANAKSAAVYLEWWWSFSEPFVREVLLSDDPQQRFMAAIIAGFSGSVKDMKVAVPTLLPHIYDNNIHGDAKLAAPALYNFGPAVVPLLLDELAVADQQAHAIMLHIIERLDHPARHLSECKNPMPRITRLFHDPMTTTLPRLIKDYWGFSY